MKRRTRRIAGAATAAVASTVLLGGCQSHPGQAAIVGNQSISVDELRGVYQRSLSTACGQQYADTPAVLERLKLTNLVVADLLEPWARAHGIQVTQGDVQAHLAELYDHFGFAPLVQAQLAQQSAVAVQDIPEAARAQLLYDDVADKLTAGIQTPDSALRSYYDQNKPQFFFGHARAIVVPDKGTADQLVSALKADPTRFSALLQQQVTKQQAKGLHLNNPESVSRGGYIGLIPLAGLEQAGLPTQPGSIYDIQQSDGWYVLQIIDNQSFDDVKQQVRQAMLASQRQQAVDKLLTQLSKQTTVKINPRFGRWDAKDHVVVPGSEPALSASPQPSPTALQCQPSQG